MFKKIEIWILYLVVLLGIPVTISFGVLVRHEMLDGNRFGMVSKTALFLAEIPANFKEILINISQDAYLASENRFLGIEGFNGTPNSKESYLLHSRYDGNLKESIVELVDLTNFKVLHSWNPDIDKFNKLVKKVDEFKNIERDKPNSRSRIRHPKLLKDGGIVFQDQNPLRKIDVCSNLIFQNTQDQFHHSIETDIDGNIWVSTHIYPQSLPIEIVGRKLRSEGGYVDDSIVKISPDGEILFQKSISKIFIDNGLEYLLFSVGERNVLPKDPIHLNDIQPVDFDGEFWKKGDLFLSLRHQSMVLLYRPDTNEIIWKGTGRFFHQHDVDILDSNRISILNNNSKDYVNIDKVDGQNEILIYDFRTNEYSTYLKDSFIKNDVRTITEGRSQILPNGDLFFEETNYGRTLYFNADGSLRWKHVNRAENGKIYMLGWSRILYTEDDIMNVDNLIKSKVICEI